MRNCVQVFDPWQTTRNGPFRTPFWSWKTSGHASDIDGGRSLCLFFARRPLVHVSWSCWFIILRWESENLYITLELGQCPFCKWNWRKDLELSYLSMDWIMIKTNSKARARPARNPGTPRPRARRHGKRKHNHRQSRSRAQTYKATEVQLSRAVTRFSGKSLDHQVN